MSKLSEEDCVEYGGYMINGKIIRTPTAQTATLSVLGKKI